MSQTSWNYWAKWRLSPRHFLDTIIENIGTSSTSLLISGDANYCHQGKNMQKHTMWVINMQEVFILVMKQHPGNNHARTSDCGYENINMP